MRLLIAARVATAQPVITSIENAASYVAYRSLALGGVFVIKGTGLGPSKISIDSEPFRNTSLTGASIALTVGSTTVNERMYFTCDSQVAALPPSNAPPGRGRFTGAYNGQTSAPAPFQPCRDILLSGTVEQLRLMQKTLCQSAAESDAYKVEPLLFTGWSTFKENL